jgi:RNA polymerase sigma-70 factor (ECF subfamily)
LQTFGDRLVDEYFDRVQRYVRLRVRAEHCEDVVNEIFLRAIQRQRELRGDKAAWLFAIARSRIAQHYRDRGRDEALGRTTGLDASQTPGEPRAPLEEMEAEEFRERLNACMDELSARERDVIAMKFTEGLTNTQIAEVLDLDPNQLGVILHRGLKRLRARMLAGSASGRKA